MSITTSIRVRIATADQERYVLRPVHVGWQGHGRHRRRTWHRQDDRARPAARGGHRVREQPQGPELDATVDELSPLGRIEAIPADLSTEAGITELVDTVGRRENSVHTLFNNAGATWGAPLEEFPDSAWDRTFDLDVKSVFTLTRALLPMLRDAATDDDPARVILVNAIAPGLFESKMSAAVLKTGGDAIAAQFPLKRIGRPDDIAGIAVFLASRASSYITGAVIPVDGGVSTTR